MRALITGASGFAGRHLSDICGAAGDDVIAVSRSAATAVDLRDGAAVRSAFSAAKPDAVYHLAAHAHVGQSWQEPLKVIEDNVAMTFNVLEAVRSERPQATVLIVSSGEIYGPPPALPVTEEAPLRPQNPYAVSKANCDLLAAFYADAHGLRVIRARAFNHAGPGQQPRYAISSFARQIAAGLTTDVRPIPIITGNPDTRRDYTDVRDVVAAYRALVERAEPGAYNICSGQTASARELVAQLAELAGVEVDHQVNEELVRDHEVMRIEGSNAKLRAATGWSLKIPLSQTLRDMVAFWQTATNQPELGARV